MANPQDTPRQNRDIVSIPTNFQGWQFRSRLEARWAAFFSLIDIRFEYECESFKLKCGLWYLPDFYLPDVGFWAEVKPSRLADLESLKASDLVEQSGQDCLLLVGPPDFTTYNAVTWLSGQYGEIPFSLDIHGIGEKIYLKERKLFACPGPLEEEEFSNRYREAICGSRSARFEVAA